jgi:DNA repair exonuclease SbcCD ATPase subunit
MTPEQRKLEEEQIKNNFSELQKKLADLKNEVQSESDDSKKQEKSEEIQKLEKELSEMKTLVDTLSSLQEADLQSLKTKLESTKKAYQEFSLEVVDLQNEKTSTPTTYELLKDSETCNRLRSIIESNPNEFKNVP